MMDAPINKTTQESFGVTLMDNVIQSSPGFQGCQFGAINAEKNTR